MSVNVIMPLCKSNYALLLYDGKRFVQIFLLFIGISIINIRVLWILLALHYVFYKAYLYLHIVQHH